MIRIRRRRRRPSSNADQALRAAGGPDSADQVLDAIQLLTEANRTQRDGQVERRLVDLRFEAFRRVRWPSAPAAPAAVVEDLFPDELIPAVDRAELTVERLRSAIQHHGSIIVRGLVGRDHVDRFIDDIDTAFDAFDAHAETAGNGNGNGTANGHDGPRPGLRDWYVPVELNGVTEQARQEKRTGGGLYAVESPPALFDLIEIFNEVGLGRLAREFLGEPPMILARKVTLRRMPHTATGGWHQDGAFMGADLRGLNVWLALTDCGHDAPSLDVVGRRVDYIVRPGGHSAPYAVSHEAAEEVGAGTIVRPIFEAGDALIFDHLCLHRTGHDPGMEKGRYAIETWLMAPSTYGAMTKPVEVGFQPFDQQPLVF